jgi:hypothetical protein
MFTNARVDDPSLILPQKWRGLGEMKKKNVDFKRVSQLVNHAKALSDKIVGSGLPDPSGMPECDELDETLKEIVKILYGDETNPTY